MATSKKATKTSSTTTEETVIEAAVVETKAEETIDVATEAEMAKEEQVAPEPIQPIVTAPSLMKKEEPVEEKTQEEKIIDFVNSRNSGEIRLNDFLRSLFPLPTLGAPAEYLQQGTSKAIKRLLEKMDREGTLTFKDKRYLLLGRGYYSGVEQKLSHKNIADTEIIIVK